VRALLIVALTLLASDAPAAFDSAAWQLSRKARLADAGQMRAAYSNCVARLQTPADDVALPVETFDDGSVRMLVQAKRAQYFIDSGLIWGEGVTIRRFLRNGSEESRIEAESCVVDRKSRRGWAEGRAKVTNGKTVFSGQGVYFSAPDAYVRVFSDSEIVSEDLKFGGGAW